MYVCMYVCFRGPLEVSCDWLVAGESLGYVTWRARSKQRVPEVITAGSDYRAWNRGQHFTQHTLVYFCPYIISQTTCFPVDIPIPRSFDFLGSFTELTSFSEYLQKVKK